MFRMGDDVGSPSRDIIGLRDDQMPGEPLLKEFMRDGVVMATYPPLTEIRSVFAADFAAFPDPVKAIRNPTSYPVEFSARLKALSDDTTQKITRSETGKGPA